MQNNFDILFKEKCFLLNILNQTTNESPDIMTNACQEQTQIEGAKSHYQEQTQIEGAKSHYQEQTQIESAKSHYQEQTQIESAKSHYQEQTQIEGVKSHDDIATYWHKWAQCEVAKSHDDIATYWQKWALCEVAKSHDDIATYWQKWAQCEVNKVRTEANAIISKIRTESELSITTAWSETLFKNEKTFKERDQDNVKEWVISPKIQKRSIKHCIRCGRKDHFDYNCYAKRDVKGNLLEK